MSISLATLSQLQDAISEVSAVLQAYEFPNRPASTMTLLSSDLQKMFAALNEVPLSFDTVEDGQIISRIKSRIWWAMIHIDDGGYEAARWWLIEATDLIQGSLIQGIRVYSAAC